MCDKKIEFTKLYLAYAQNKVSTIASFLQNLLQATKKNPWIFGMAKSTCFNKCIQED